MKEALRQEPLDQSASQYRQFFELAADAVIVVDLQSSVVLDANPAACRMHGYSSDEFVGLPLAALIHPDSRKAFLEHLHSSAPDVTPSIGTRHVRRDGSAFFAEWRGTVFTNGDASCLLGIVRDVSERMQAEQVLLHQVAARSHEQATLMEISQSLASTLEFRPAWILDRLLWIIEYDVGAFFRLEGSALVSMSVCAAPDLDLPSQFRIELRGANPAEILAARGPVLIGDLWDESEQARRLSSILNQDGAGIVEGMRSCMWVPVAAKGQVLGGLGLLHVRRDFFTTHDADLALKVANQAAITMINAELVENAKSLAALQERQRLAQNLHDAVNQSLFSAGLIAEVLPRMWDQGEDTIKQSLAELHRLIRGATAEMRALLAELRPSTLTDADLGELLQLLANAFTGKTNVPATVTITGEGTLPGDVQVTIYRICQEAMNNIARHANAHKVEISLCHTNRGIELTIADDGRGFDPAETTSGHYGLGMMRERAAGISAGLTITSLPGHGTAVGICWPRSLFEEVR